MTKSIKSNASDAYNSSEQKIEGKRPREKTGAKKITFESINNEKISPKKISGLPKGNYFPPII